jgi:hypothetical protein
MAGPNANMSVSPNGLTFLYNREAQAGVSNKPPLARRQQRCDARAGL